MRPQFRVIFTVSLGKPWLWAQSKAGIRSVAPFFHDGRGCERARVIEGASPNWAAYRAANSPRCQAIHGSGTEARSARDAVLPSVVIDWSCLSALRIGANRRRTDWRALSPAFAQEGNLFTIQTPTRRKRALNVWGFNGCGAPGNNTVGKIRASSILTKSKEPLTGIIELRTDGGPIELTIDEDAALALRTDLKRFLTQ